MAGEAADHKPVVVKFDNVSCWYDRNQPPILQNINLEVREGEFVLLTGPSGAGKTTLGLLINGIIPHVEGFMASSVQVDGTVVFEASVAQLASKVGFVFQDVDSQLVMMYVRDEVAFGMENLNWPTGQVRQGVQEALEFVGLAGFDNRFVFELSGGQKQKIAIASVLAMKPKVLFLDEPTANLDPKSTKEVFDLLARLKGETTIIIFDNKVDDLVPLADRVVAIHKGQVVADGPPAEVYSEKGAYLAHEIGCWVPQVCEVEIALCARGLGSGLMPLTVEQALEQYGRLHIQPRPEPASRRVQPGDPIIVVEDLTHIYPNSGAGIRNVSATIHRGERVAIVGPNGSGKTTLVKHFVGFYKPQRGRVLVAGKDTRNTSTRELVRHVGYVFQYPDHQFVTDTVEDEIAFSLRATGVAEDEVRGRVRELLRVFDLEGREKRHPFSLSGGEKRRLSVATMLIVRPRALILDEPTYGQDRLNTQRMMESLLAAEETHGDFTLLLVTHDMKLVASYATRVIAMREGRKAFDGSVRDLFAQPQLLEDVNLEDPPLFRLARGLRVQGKDVPRWITSTEDLVSLVADDSVPDPVSPHQGR